MSFPRGDGSVDMTRSGPIGRRSPLKPKTRLKRTSLPSSAPQRGKGLPQQSAWMADPKPMVRRSPDGREVCNQAAWRARRVEAFLAYDGRCGKCGDRVSMQSFDLDHKHGRGMGGGKRDDRLYGDDGTLDSGAVWPLCRWKCHRLGKHGSGIGANSSPEVPNGPGAE